MQEEIFMKDYDKIIQRFNNKKILVIGDVILDQYIIGSVSRISPEAPVPVVHQEKSFCTSGGAANVAQNLRKLGAQVTIVGRIGKDLEGELLIKELKKSKINTKAIFIDRRFPTVCKTRILAKHQQVVRIDREKINGNGKSEAFVKIFEYISKNLNQFDAIIISDYGKGLVTPELVELTRDLALKEKKIITVDPKVEHFCYYRNVTAITPNQKEAENAIRNIKIQESSGHKLNVNMDRLNTMKDVDLAGRELLKYLELDSLLLTLGERGMRLFEKGKKPVSIATKAQEVFDVTGAGDAVISVFTLALTAGATKVQAADISNFAAGIVVGRMGAASISKADLLQAIKG